MITIPDPSEIPPDYCPGKDASFFYCTAYQRSCTRSPSPSRSRARSPSSSPPHAPARDAEDPVPAAASSRISQEEKARLHAVYDRVQDEDREAQDDLRIKFRLQRNGDESPIMYGALVPLKKGDEHHAGEELTWFSDKNFAHWNPLPKWVGCSFPDDEQAALYTKYLARMGIRI
ncbi:hypothetical protein K438DRAFT_1782860 [Mycena galopus ATCC 62051]|nr:hypothetical protein K438DRAFT_1782860 [Mycena galopus ATCC 62051]